MPILKISDAVEFYRHMAVSSGVQVLSGRGTDKEATRFANSRILAALDLVPEDVLLDIGCGDGCLLQMARGQVAASIGLVPTKEEQAELLAALPEFDFRVGLAQNLPLPSGCVTKIVCNGVLLLLKDQDEVRAALLEIGRVARAGSRIFLGEIPAANEYEHFRNYSGDSVAGLLWNQWRYKGTRAFLSSAKTAVRSCVGSETLVLSSFAHYYASPDRFTELAEQCGLRLKTHFKYTRLDRSGDLIESPHRYNYIFTK